MKIFYFMKYDLINQWAGKTEKSKDKQKKVRNWDKI